MTFVEVQDQPDFLLPSTDYQRVLDDQTTLPERTFVQWIYRHCRVAARGQIGGWPNHYSAQKMFQYVQKRS